MRPTIDQLAGCRRLCDNASRFARVFEWNGVAVKLYRPQEHFDGLSPIQRLSFVMPWRVQRRLEEAEVQFYLSWIVGWKMVMLSSSAFG